MTPRQAQQMATGLMQQLRHEREGRGLTREAVMRRGGPSPKCVRNIETGQSGPTLTTFIGYADALDLEVFLAKRVPILGKVK